jgi:anti-anti-sigma factor
MPNPVTSVEQLPGAVVIRVRVRQLGSQAVEALVADIARARAGDAASLPVILDLAEVEYAGSMALGALVGLSREFHRAGQRLIFVSMTAEIHRLFADSYVNKLLEVMEDVPAALRSLGPGDGPAA